MNENLKCKICGCILMGIIVSTNYPICKCCKKYLDDSPHIVENVYSVKIRQNYIVSLSGTASTISTSTGWLDEGKIF